MWEYTVQRGDTLIGVSTRELDDVRRWPALQRLNRVAEPRRLQPGTVLRIPLAWLRAEPAVAALADVTGNVQLRGADGTSSAAADGSPVRSRDTVVTAAAASAVLRLADGSSVFVAPSTRMQVQQLLQLRGSGGAAATLQLERGALESQVRREAPRPRFEVRTPVLNLGVRGTEFRARYDEEQRRAWAEVTRGQVLATPPAAPAAAPAPGRRAAAPALPATPLGEGQGLIAGAGGIGAPAPLLPAPDLAASPRRVERLPLTLAWSPLAGAQAWQLQVFDGGSQRLLHEQRTTAPAATIGDLPDGSHRVRVRAADAQGLQGRAAEYTLVLKARPEPPFLREPQAQAVVIGERVNFLWVRSSAAASYRLQLARDDGFAAPEHDLPSLAGPAHDLALAAGRWHWRLASVRADGDQGPWSDAQSFELEPTPPPPPPPPPVPAMSQPPAADTGRLLLRWASGRPGDRFQFQLAAEPGFVAPAVDRTVDEPQAAIELPPPGRWYVRSRTVDAGGTAGPWSPASEFEVPRSAAWWWLAPLLLLLLL